MADRGRSRYSRSNVTSWTFKKQTTLLRLLFTIGLSVRISVQYITRILWLKQALDCLQAQGIAPLEDPQLAANPVVDTTSGERDFMRAESQQVEHKPKAKVEETIKRESDVSEDDDDDDIKAFQVRSSCLLLFPLTELFIRP